jgi:hypothetical protein
MTETSKGVIRLLAGLYLVGHRLYFMNDWNTVHSTMRSRWEHELVSDYENGVGRVFQRVFHYTEFSMGP